jgi:hypothetical protein
MSLLVPFVQVIVKQLHGVYDENIENGQYWRDGGHVAYELEPKKTTPSPAVLDIFQKYGKEQQQQKQSTKD